MNTSPTPTPLRRRWLGLLLSLLVPGFGILRAGLPWRAAAWFLGLHLGFLFVLLSFSLSIVPIWLAIIFCAGAFVAQIWMLVESFRPGRMTLPLWGLFGSLLAICVFLPSLIWLVVGAFKIPTGGMEPTLLGSPAAAIPDQVLVDRLSYRLHAPQRGDIIVFATSQMPGIRRPPNRTEREIFYVKRLVGLPGEKVRIANGKLYANGKQLGEADGIPALNYVEPFGRGSEFVKRAVDDYLVGPNEYFVIGDNSPDSYDSRYWGCVPASALHGKVTLIYYPFSRAGRIALGQRKSNKQTN